MHVKQIDSYNANVRWIQKILQKSVCHAALLHDYISKHTHTIITCSLEQNLEAN